MKNSKFREFLQQKAIKTGAIVLASALVLTSSYWSDVFKNETQSFSEAELPVFTDPFEEAEVNRGEAPGGSNPKVTTTTKTTKSTKKVKLKSKSKKTYTKTSSPETKTTTSLTSKFTKGSKINTQTTTVTTVTTTTVEDTSGESVVIADTAAAAAAPAQAEAQTTAASGPLMIGSAAPKLDSRVSNAYTALGFTINVNPSVNYSGVFDARSKSITLKKTGDTIYHEIGHFVAFVAGNVDKAAAFQQVFAQEKGKYTMYNKAYVLQNSSEYFAESFKNYTLDPNTLRAERPLTYSAIESALNNVTDAQVAKIKAVYRAVWGE